MLIAVAILLATIPVPALLAASADDQLEEEVLALRRQVHDLRKQIIDKYVAAGKLTAEEGEKYKQKLDERFEWQLKHGFEKPKQQMKGKIQKLKPKLRQMQEVPVD